MKRKGFDDIYKQWENSVEKKGKKDARESVDMNALLDMHPPRAKELEEKKKGLRASGDGKSPQKNYATMAPQASLDLHGSTVEEAERLVTAFLQTCKKRNLKKVLIIHGKGKHAADGSSPLRDSVRQLVARSPLTGQSGTPPERLGGSGAIWVVVR